MSPYDRLLRGFLTASSNRWDLLARKVMEETRDGREDILTQQGREESWEREGKVLRVYEKKA